MTSIESVSHDELRGWLDAGYARAVRTAYLILGHREDAEDAVQEAYLRAWRFRGSLARSSSFQPWLYRVIVNACNSTLRREIPRRLRTADDELELAESPGGDPTGVAEEHEIAIAVRSLPERLRTVVVLKYYADLSETEIAETIGRPAGTVKSRLHEARRRLAEHPLVRAPLVEEGDIAR